MARGLLRSRTKALEPSKTFTVTAQLTKPSQSIIVQISSVNILYFFPFRRCSTYISGVDCWDYRYANVQTFNAAHLIPDHGYPASDSFGKSNGYMKIALLSKSRLQEHDLEGLADDEQFWAAMQDTPSDEEIVVSKDLTSRCIPSRLVHVLIISESGSSNNKVSKDMSEVSNFSASQGAANRVPVLKTLPNGNYEYVDNLQLR